MYRLDFTERARVDLSEILGQSLEAFGPSARARYETLLEVSFVALTPDPMVLGSQARNELNLPIRTYHLHQARRLARARGANVSTPRHVIAYTFDASRVLIVRILHEAMDLARHIPRGGPT